MPYIITTAKTGRIPLADGTIRRGLGTSRVESRHAVATMDEARASIQTDLCDRHGATGPEDPAIVATLDLSESGGTIGPLPDGTVVEVQPVLIENLIASAGIRAQYITASRYADTAMTDADVIDAYNAASLTPVTPAVDNPDGSRTPAMNERGQYVASPKESR